VSGSPDLYYESLSANGRTFARVVPTDKLEAKALVGEMQAIGVKRLYARSDSTEAKLIEGDLSAVGITAASTMAGADGVLFAGNSVGDAAQLFNQAATSNPAVKLFATSALATNSLVAKLSPAARRELYVSSPGFTSAQLPSNFVSAFKGAYGHAPATQAIFGYEAMAAVLATLQKAGSSANNRGTVVKDFFAIRNRNSPLGTYSIDKNGDISFANGAPFVLERVKGGKLEAVQKLG
jgi:branched-chain amino acid transport system substrate-binding protein